MPRTIHRLTARRVATLTQQGRHADGGGLYLFISDGGRKRWIFRYTRHGRTHEMGLGSAAPSGISLASARELASRARLDLAHGRDPIKERDDARRSKRVMPTFRDVLEAYIETNRPVWRSTKHADQWRSSLDTHAGTIMGMRVDEIETDDVLRVLKPIWRKIPETAGRVRGRIETVLDSASAQGLRNGANPARWRGHLAQVLPKRAPMSRGHHASMHYSQVPAFLRELMELQTLSARALEVTILSGLRTKEVLQAHWDEIDLEQAVWSIPGERMKSGRPHRVPLLGRSFEILKNLGSERISEWVFPSMRGKPLSNMAMLTLLKRMGRKDITVHGFRASLRTWASEKTSFPTHIAEMALAHTISDKLEAAYQRGDLFEKRKEFMRAWDSYCMNHAANVVNLSNVRSS